MKGKDLQKAIKNNGILIAELSQKSGIPETTIFKLYKKQEVPTHYLEKIEGAGVELPKTTNDGPSMEVIKHALKLIEQSMKNFELNIQDLRDNNLSIRNTNAELTDSHRTYRGIVELCVKQGVLKVDASKSVKF